MWTPLPEPGLPRSPRGAVKKQRGMYLENLDGRGAGLTYVGDTRHYLVRRTDGKHCHGRDTDLLCGNEDNDVLSLTVGARSLTEKHNWNEFCFTVPLPHWSVFHSCGIRSGKKMNPTAIREDMRRRNPGRYDIPSAHHIGQCITKRMKTRPTGRADTVVTVSPGLVPTGAHHVTRRRSLLVPLPTDTLHR